MYACVCVHVHMYVCLYIGCPTLPYEAINYLYHANGLQNEYILYILRTIVWEYMFCNYVEIRQIRSMQSIAFGRYMFTLTLLHLNFVRWNLNRDVAPNNGKTDKQRYFKWNWVYFHQTANTCRKWILHFLFDFF